MEEKKIIENDLLLKENKLYVKKLSSKAIIPKRFSSGAAGYDMFSLTEDSIKPHSKGLISTGLVLMIPFGYYGRIAPRSSLASKNFIDVGAGVIDSDYRGEIKILLFNFSDQEFKINEGDRIAQLIIEKIIIPEIEEVKEINEETKRGEGGFGSTGKWKKNIMVLFVTFKL